MIPTKEQTPAGWRTLPDRETWDAHVARGGVWQWMHGVVVQTTNCPWQMWSPLPGVQYLWRPIDPHAGSYWPLPGAVPTGPGLWERRDRDVPVAVVDVSNGPKCKLVWVDLDKTKHPVTPDGQWICTYVKTRG